jgi:hypothetical protein
MTNVNLPKILPCPFCGSEPEVMGSGEGQRGLMIHCMLIRLTPKTEATH